MPKILDRLVSQLKAKGMSEKAAYAVATKQLQKSGNIRVLQLRNSGNIRVLQLQKSGNIRVLQLRKSGRQA